MYKVNSYFYIFIFFVCYLLGDQKVDLIVFSYNRPMQLWALLEGIDKYINGLGARYVICRADAEFKNAYKDVEDRYKNFNFLYQGNNPKLDFKPYLLKAFKSEANKYIMFAVDDIIVKDYIDLNKCINCLEKYKAYAFFLRLGKNIDYCFMTKTNTPVPSFINVEEGVNLYKFSSGSCDWRYPNNNDMTIYRKIDIVSFFKNANYSSTGYEGLWSIKANLNQLGLFFDKSKILNLSINLVGDVPNLRQFTNEELKIVKKYSSKELLKLFYESKRIDISYLGLYENKSPHVCIDPFFVDVINK